MRLIDADDLIKAFEALDLMNGQYAESFSNMAGNRSMEIESAINYIENAKTIDAKPIVHAHWIEGQTDNPNIHNILCSCCFEGCPSKGHANSQYTKKKFKWCPRCGAKMYEEVEKNE